jgi:hypothetical protein
MARAGTGNDATDYNPDVLMCVAVKPGFALHKVMAAAFIGADIGSWWA